MSSPLPTLDTKGVVSDPLMKLQWILSHLITTEQSQTNAHRNLVFSLPDLIRRTGNNEPELRRELEYRLKSTLERYFDSTIINVSTRDLPNNGAAFEVVLRVQVLQDEQWHDLSHSLTVIRDKLEIVTEFNSK